MLVVGFAVFATFVALEDHPGTPQTPSPSDNVGVSKPGFVTAMVAAHASPVDSRSSNVVSPRIQELAVDDEIFSVAMASSPGLFLLLQASIQDVLGSSCFLIVCKETLHRGPPPTRSSVKGEVDDSRDWWHGNPRMESPCATYPGNRLPCPRITPLKWVYTLM
jgi:hypothetical protein